MKMDAIPKFYTTLWMLFFAMLCVSAGCSMSAIDVPTPQPSEPGPYRIGVSDVLLITVFEHDGLQVQAPVRSDGKISVPLLDDVQAEGLTPDHLGDVISEMLSPLVKNPDVTVTVISPDSKTVTVTGAVLRSGRIPLTHNMGVLEAIAVAGGFNAWANKNSVRVIRGVGGGRASYRFNYRAYVKGLPDSDILLEPGDVVIVPE
jgi:polysaccharide export outer membrane protein